MIRQRVSASSKTLLARRFACAVLALSLALTGCDFVKSFFGGEPAKPPVAKPAPQDKKKKKKEEAAKAAPAPAPAVLPQSLSLSVAPPISVKQCQISLTPAAGQVPAILKIASYADKKSETYPSVFIQATVPSGEIKDLLEQPLPAKVFVARGASGPFFTTPEGQSAQVTLKTADDQHVTGEIANATLVDQASGQSATATGKFDGKLIGK